MGLFGDKTTIDLQVANEVVVPGDLVAAHVVVGGERDDKLQGGRVELGYENRYYKREYRSSSSDSSFSSSSGGWEDVLRTEAIVVATEALSLGGGPGPAAYDVALALPLDAPASVNKWVEWNVTAMLDRRRGRDRSETVPLTVLCAPGTHAAWAQAQQVSNADCDMFLELPTRTVGLGDTLAGVLNVVPTSSFSARAVRVQLEHRMQHEDDIVRTLGKEETTVAGSTAFQPGQALRLPFQVGVPPDGIPSLRAKHSEVHWSVKGVCDRRMRGDYTVEAEVEVYNAPPGSGSVPPWSAAPSPVDQS